MSGGRAASSGVLWAGISQGGRIVAQIVTVSVLSRILPPADFGLIAIATVVTTFATLLRDMGTAAAVIQRKELKPELVNTVFWFNVLVGLSLALLVAASALPLSIAFKQPRLGAILLALTVTFPSASVGAVHQALLEREMRFRTLARIEVSSALVALAIAIVAALSGFGVYSLVLNTIAISLFASGQLWFASRWRPRFAWSRAEFHSLWGFSGNLFGFQVVNYFSRNADTMLIGRFLGATDVGIYNMAYRIMLFPLASLSTVISRVMFPMLSRKQGDTAAFGAMYLKVASAIGIITIPLMAALWVLRIPFVEVVLGRNWLPVAEVLAWFAPVGMIQSILTTVGVIYMGTGNTKRMLQWGMGYAAVLIVFIAVGLNWGYLGVARAYALAVFVAVYPAFAIPLRLVGLRVPSLVAALWRPGVAAIGMALVLFALEMALHGLVPATVRLPLLVAVGIGVYLVLGWLIMRTALLELLQAIRPK